MDTLFDLASILTPIIILLTLGYGLACWAYPFRICRACRGSGRRMSITGRSFRPCRSCGGTGGVLRLGRRLYNEIQRRRREGSR